MTWPTTPERCTKAEYARHRGVHPSLISRWAKQHKIVLDENGKVVGRSDELLSVVLHPTKGGGRNKRRDALADDTRSRPQVLPTSHSADHEAHSPDSAPPPAGAGQGAQAGASALSVAEATRAEKIVRTRILLLEEAEKAGALVRRDVVEAETFKRARQAQELLMALKDRLVPLLAAENDEHAIDTLLDAELRQVIAVIAGTRASNVSLEDAA